MPFYEFRCDHCGARLEREFRIAAAIQTPDCHGCDRPMTRIYTAPGVAFKGTGWGKDPK